MPYVGQTGRSLSQLVRSLTQEKDFVEPSNMPRNYGGPQMSSGSCPLYKNIVTISLNVKIVEALVAVRKGPFGAFREVTLWLWPWLVCACAAGDGVLNINSLTPSRTHNVDPSDGCGEGKQTCEGFKGALIWL